MKNPFKKETKGTLPQETLDAWKDLPVGEPVDIEISIMASNFCADCWPDKQHASFIYDGKSLCEKCFAKT